MKTDTERLLAHLPELRPADFDSRPDYEIAAEELRAFYAGLGLTHTITRLGKRCDESMGRKWEHYAYAVSLTRPSFAGEQVFPWRQGTGVTKDPDPAEVLAHVAEDYEGTQGRTFEEWASEYGYDSDSRAAEKVFQSCIRLAAQVRALGLSGEQLSTLADFARRL